LQALGGIYGRPLSDRLSGGPSGHDRDRLGTPVTSGALVIESERQAGTSCR